MVTFDRVLPTVVELVEALPDFDLVQTCAIVRDLQGRVRLVVENKANTPFDRRPAELALGAVLANYFQPPIVATHGRPDEIKLARFLLDKAEPFEAEYIDRISGQTRSSDVKWRKYEARLSKNAWLGRPDRVWELGKDRPCITAFFSFKGGVGRTTALVACAWQLASEGAKVVVIDLDLEAPGAGALLGAQTERGIIDVLVDRLATKRVDLTGSHAPAAALGPEAGSVHVFPAGALDKNFIEKLARLDYTQATSGASAQRSPIEEAMRDILQKISADLKPTHIFLDARSGLHDLSAMSLLRLAHVDVLLARASEQSYQGLDLTIRTLLRRKGAEHLQPILVHTMAAGGGTPAAKEERQDFLERAYKTFSEAYYHPYGRSHALQDDSAPHAPVVISFKDVLVRFGNLAAIRTDLFAPEYRYLCDRIKLRAQSHAGGGTLEITG